MPLCGAHCCVDCHSYYGLMELKLAYLTMDRYHGVTDAVILYPKSLFSSMLLIFTVNCYIVYFKISTRDTDINNTYSIQLIIHVNNYLQVFIVGYYCINIYLLHIFCMDRIRKDIKFGMMKVREKQSIYPSVNLFICLY